MADCVVARMGGWMDLLLMSLTFIFTIVWNVEVGIAVSLVISLLLVVHRSSKTRLTILVRCTSEACETDVYGDHLVGAYPRHQPVETNRRGTRGAGRRRGGAHRPHPRESRLRYVIQSHVQ